jgi:hypothetical protein
MAELTANDISRLLAPTNDGVRALTIEQEQTSQNIETINSALENVGVTIRDIFKQVSRISKHVDRPPVIKNGDDNSEQKTDEMVATPLETISSHLADIKDFLKQTFQPTGLSGSTQDTNIGMLDKQEKEDQEEDQKQIAAGPKGTALAWLGGLFAVGALGQLSKVFGIGAGAGVAGGLLAKIAPAIFKWTGPIMRRIPIIGSLFSFYEAYKKFQAGGIDNIIFGIMDVAAGIAYAVPSIGTAIGLGLDVLQYFLKEKANEWKKETGETSFFGSMWDKIMEYLKKTPMFKWFIDTGKKGKEFWDNPTLETFKAFGGQFFSVLQPLLDTFSMFDKDAGAALGLTDDKGKPQGLFGWVADKVDEWIITPVMDFLESIFVSIGESMIKVGKSIDDFIKRVVDNNISDGMIKDSVYWAFGWNKGPEPEGGWGEVEELKRKPVKEKEGMRKAVKDLAKHVGGKFGEEDYLKYLDAATPEQLIDANTMLRYKATEKGILEDFNKQPDPQTVPPTIEQEQFFKNQLREFIKPQSNINTSINNQSVTYVAPVSPSVKHLTQQGIGG